MRVGRGAVAAVIRALKRRSDPAGGRVKVMAATKPEDFPNYMGRRIMLSPGRLGRAAMSKLYTGLIADSTFAHGAEPLRPFSLSLLGPLQTSSFMTEIAATFC
ncbi:hypothetical protein EN766_13085 [Mesorhizobium sp. M2A.F.Ca.ET.046.02.1.1]|nr:hypothetical protein EN766_13085 [Mesorhizobium sp. M2A.F.Ca.ET.046.02.1.1]TIW59764.1 MAG: hypothetical protein E5V48_16535 [Mesorhizobium sp.]